MVLKTRDGEMIDLGVSLSQLKKIYVALFRQLHQAGFAAMDELDEDDMLLTIQSYLQRRAAEEGVDGTIHSHWERWLGMQHAPSCEQRFADRSRPAEH
jgi:hypothetical protein